MATTKKAAEKAEEKKSVFQTLNEINVNEHTEVKDNGQTKLTYLSWVWAWAQVKNLYPDANYEVKHWDGKPFLYDESLGFMVETSVTIQGETMTMWLPVMDSKNKAMKATAYEYSTGYGKKMVKPATMFDINTTIMRCLVKNLAMFGLGLYIYAGEDLPQVEKDAQANKPAPAKKSWYKAGATSNEVADMMRRATTMEDVRNIYLAYPAYQAELVEVGKEMQSVLSNN